MRLITIWRGRELVGLAPLMIVARKKYGLTFQIALQFQFSQCGHRGISVPTR